MKEYEHRIAQVRVNRNGDWLLRILGTDIHYLLWRDRDIEHGVFPGSAMGHRLVELGWVPDRRRMFTLGGSPVEKLAASTMAGWSPVEGEEKMWRMPCWRERQE